MNTPCQEDGPWHAERLFFQGIFVDAVELAQALADVQETIKLHSDLDRERGKELPAVIDLVASVWTHIPIAAL